MSTTTPLLQQTIEPDEAISAPASNARPAAAPVVLTPGNSQQMATNASDAESGIAGIFRQSAHPAVLFFLYFFRIAAIAVYVLCGLFTDNYVVSTVVVVVLLSMDFWNCRNVSGRTLVGLRFWNQVDEDGESYWVFESRDPSRPANPVDSKMFWIALYTFPAAWLLLFVVSIIRFNVSFVPIVILALVFNITLVIGYTYADRDAKQRWATGIATSGWNLGMGGIGGQIVGGVMKNSVGKLFG
ncbi:Golgi apparatus membrane protein TVP23 [Coniophora puteana RWD-64-598 SS2]|uniref:Golgi apparatus membrane protein TVP23 n=1 Tax=Coniophora puteana (strain RWD-64-598) TaxID=741705 RepID=A0A5M3N5L3_CONPW|nr:Golgi apparatus membrane protein TVP23 [Coniophora puteana RWD-64-598 SS2]EIW86547.1 Golgi apparatus membrane protein TVP23 [Coniophora puteana RWD-64-598 SS2]